MRIRGLVAALGVTTLLAACAGVAGDPKDPVAVWAEIQAEFLAEHGEFPEGDPAYTEEEAHAAIAEQAAVVWRNHVLSQFPRAVPPTEGFIRWSKSDDILSLESDLATCLTSHGVRLEPGYLADGSIGGMSSYPDGTEASQVGSFYCSWVAYPQRPSPPPNAARLGYIWDYYAEFLVPCYEDNDIPQTPMPSREDWIASSPAFTWTLQPPTDDTEFERVQEMCPTGPIH